MEHRAFDIGQLVNDAPKQIPTHVGGWLKLLVGARAGRAQQIATIGCLEIDTDWRVLRGSGPDASLFEIVLRRERGSLNHSAAL